MLRKGTETHAILLLWSLRKEARHESYLKEYTAERLIVHEEGRAADYVSSHFGTAEARYQEFLSWCEQHLSHEGLVSAGLRSPRGRRARRFHE